MDKGELFSFIDLEKRETEITNLPMQILFEHSLNPNNKQELMEMRHLKSDLTDHVQWKRIADKATGPKFTDEIFPANKDSLSKGFILPRNLKDILEREIIWKSLKSSQVPFKLVENISYASVSMGLLDTSYLLSAVACLAEDPYFINRVMIDQEMTNNGLYGFNFNENGTWKTIAVDDNLPFLVGENISLPSIKITGDLVTNLGCLALPNAAWCPLLEKAYAKFKGSYANICFNGDV